MQHLLASLAIATPLTMGLVVAPEPPPGHQVFRFQDARITEASALVVDDGLFVTVDDSGHTGDVFVVDRTGRTVGVTHWSDDPVDTEALAPGGPGFVWVGDIGDNLASRASVEVARVPVGRGVRRVQPATYELIYPDRAADAETLLRDPSSGRLYVATKSVFGGVLYAAPEHLDASRPNRLKAVGRVLPVATDGSFDPAGDHLVIRNYTTAVVYEWPSLQPAGRLPLPSQRQGEGIGVAADGRVYVSSEGPRAPVLQVRLPPAIQAELDGSSDATAMPSPTETPSTPSTPSTPRPSDGSSAEEPEPTSRDAWPWLAGGLLGLAALVVLLRALRPR